MRGPGRGNPGRDQHAKTDKRSHLRATFSNLVSLPSLVPDERSPPRFTICQRIRNLTATHCHPPTSYLAPS